MSVRLPGVAGCDLFGSEPKLFGGMAGKRAAQPSEYAQDQQRSAKRQTPPSAAETLVPVTITFSMRCDATALPGGQEALEASLKGVVAEFGGRDFRLGRTRVGPNDDTLQRVLPFVLEHVGAAAVMRCSQACKPWRLELEARGFCNKTFQLCAALSLSRSAQAAYDSDGEDSDEMEGCSVWNNLGQNALQRLNASAGPLCLDVNSFLQRSWGWGGGLHEWLQAASQESGVSFLHGAVSTAHILGYLPIQNERTLSLKFARLRKASSCDVAFF